MITVVDHVRPWFTPSNTLAKTIQLQLGAQMMSSGTGSAMSQPATRTGLRPTRSDSVPAGPVTLMCGHGERAMSAASVLERAGRRDVLVLVGGPTDWATATGGTLALGS